MPRKEKLKKEQVINAIKKCQGFMGLAAKDLGVCYKTFYNYCQRYKEIKEVVESQEAVSLDMAELSLLRGVKLGKAWAIKYLLDCKGHKRGYIKRHEITVPESAPIRYIHTIEGLNITGNFEEIAKQMGLKLEEVSSEAINVAKSDDKKIAAKKNIKKNS